MCNYWLVYERVPSNVPFESHKKTLITFMEISLLHVHIWRCWNNIHKSIMYNDENMWWGKQRKSPRNTSPDVFLWKKDIFMYFFSCSVCQFIYNDEIFLYFCISHPHEIQINQFVLSSQNVLFRYSVKIP